MVPALIAKLIRSMFNSGRASRINSTTCSPGSQLATFIVGRFQSAQVTADEKRGRDLTASTDTGETPYVVAGSPIN